MMEQKKYLEFSESKRPKKFTLFVLVGIFGILINSIVLYLLVRFANLHYIIASVAAIEAAIISNFLGNHFITFRKEKTQTNFFQKFLMFQSFSVLTIIGTVGILAILAVNFGKELLLVWNLVAISIMFLANFFLNLKITWAPSHGVIFRNKLRAFLFPIILVLFFSGAHSTLAADVVSVSQLGYHPDSQKQVIVYTDDESGQAFLRSADNLIDLKAIELAKARDYDGNEVECQGNIPCLVGDFTDFNIQGTYQIVTNSGQSATFRIDKDIFESNLPILLEFFDAMAQQGSNYHADFHANYNPQFTSIADGSFIMEADQAAISLIRLGNAYRRNPELFKQSHNLVMSSGNDIAKYLNLYINYLESLQGLQIEERTDGMGFRLNPSTKINHVFVPGPTDLNELEIFIPGNPPKLLDTIPVVSLCGEGSGTEWDACIDKAANFYKCQIDEPCLDISYIEKTGTVKGNNGYGVARGWSYEFGCFVDISLGERMFDDKPNPCHIFHDEQTRQNTVLALHGFLQAIPAVYDSNKDSANSLLQRSINTYEFIKDNFDSFNENDKDAGHFGSSLFLLHDYTKDKNYLLEAHGLKNKIPITLISDMTRGNEFYWEEYARHKNDIISEGLEYAVGGQNPEEFFIGKMFFDYKDRGFTSISKNGERVFQFDPNIQFQNSRFILTEGLIAAKTMDLEPGYDKFIADIAHNQLAWITGMNAVQMGQGLGAPVKPISFIFGIGDFPKEFHSRYLVNTGYKDGSNGEIVGARGTSLQFFDGEDYVFLDGRHEILGQQLGALGNGYRDEPKIYPYKTGTKFLNGKEYIPGWINGAFDVNTNPNENDVIFNFDDNVDTYEFTETTNEVVSTAVALFSYLDAQLNNRNWHEGVFLNAPGDSDTNDNDTNDNEGDSNNDDLENNNESNGNDEETNEDNNEETNEDNNEENDDNADNTGEDSDENAGNESNENGEEEIPDETNNDGSDGSENNESNNDQNNNDSNNDDGNIGDGNNEEDNNGNESNDGGNENAGNETIDENPENETPQDNNDTSENTEQNDTETDNNLDNSDSASFFTASSTNLTSGGSNIYHMYENDAAFFKVELNGTDDILWKVDDETIKQESSSASTLEWAPGLLYTSNVKRTSIKAISGNQEKEWVIDVEFVVNPFFSSLNDGPDSIGSSDTAVHVFTNKDILDADELKVLIKSNDAVTAYELAVNFIDEAKNEVDWRRELTGVPHGNNFIVGIEAKKNNSNETTVFNFEESRAHYRSFPEPPPSENSGGSDNRESGSDSSGSRGQRGSGGGFIVNNPEVVYAVFGKDVIRVDQEQNLTLDAKIKLGDIEKVQAAVLTPNGNLLKRDMRLVSGTNNYGTWSASFMASYPGKYMLQTVSLWPKGKKDPVNAQVRNTSFYAVSDIVGKEEHLMLVYTALNESIVKNGSIVMLTLDARDKDGVKKVNAAIRTNRNISYKLPLVLTAGNANYGTWKAAILADTPDATYSVASIELVNDDASKTYPVSDREFYVEALPTSDVFSGVTGSVVRASKRIRDWSFEALRKIPLFPTLLGFAAAFIIVLLVTTGTGLGKKFRKNILKR